ncbi:MAG TPA: aminodeoxychorismate synthase component I [Methylotenera sp.]|nr:aminodeoxychorismate synthase component I [Methylotenera sp.]HPH04453.1 aminodeoxychorismate synthase component I [Methylotenera sp.]HPN00858.1 aminodeoxychorismate synthase component I [Methylotenera sp.]
MLKHALPYHHNTARLFAHIAHCDWAMWLDSAQQHNHLGAPSSQYGHYDILVAKPRITFVSVGDETQITENGQVTLSNDDPFQLVKNVLGRYTAHAEPKVPFAGGALGYFAYDLGKRIEKHAENKQIQAKTPQMMVGIYDCAVVVDHQEKTAFLVSQNVHQNARENFDALQALFCAASSGAQMKTAFKITSKVISNLTKLHYEHAFNKVKKYILEGDCYQVNLAQRFSANAQGDGWQAYQKLREISPAPFMAYMRLPQCEVLCASPERFLQVNNQHVETRPIKGTRPRSDNAKQDAQNATELQDSLKDRAENLMIVDLLRNDIGKNCAIGSVKADKLFQLQSFANVHHLVSIIMGKLAKGKTALDLLRGCFPGGSITGAPKLRAMQIIEELEPHQRGLYCGAIGYIGFDGNMDTNIAIRTAVYADGEISFYAGGGIVADSELEKEYTETFDKASSMMKLMQFFQQ